MKKSMLGLAALCCVSGAAMAQSSVTVFGIVDLAARSLKGADTVKFLSNEGRSASRLGFRGVEDMGGGMKASFHIEHGLNPDSGTTDSVFWQRRATVSLSGPNYRAIVQTQGPAVVGVTVSGLHKVDDEDGPRAEDPFFRFFRGMPGLQRIMGLDRNRIDNQVGYYLPSMGGVYGNVEVSMGEGSTSNAGSGAARSVAGRLGYRAAGLNVSLAHGQYGSASKLKITALGGSYAIGDLTLMGQHSTFKLGASTHKVSNLSASVKLGAGKLIGSYGRAAGITNAKANLLALGYDHSLSKRTTLYTTVARIDNKEASTFSLGGATGRALPVAGGNSSGYEFGIRHTV
jgi:predicted porin